MSVEEPLPRPHAANRRPPEPRLAAIAAAAILLVVPRAALPAQPVFELVPLPGLTDAEHTDAQGHHVSLARLVDGSGLVYGMTNRTPPSPSGPAWHGVTGWVYDPATALTTRAALDPVPFAPLDRVCSNGVVETTTAGFALGTTTCDDSGFPGFVWAYDGPDRIRTFLGLSGPDHANPIDGRPLSRLLPYVPGRISESGHVPGTTDRWLPAPGLSAWLYDSTTRSTGRIGLIDAEHTASDGAQWSWPSIVSAAGNVAGYSERAVAGTFLDSSAWIHRASSGVSRRVGFYDGDGRGSVGFTAADGRQSSTISTLTDSGYAAGHSTRFQGSSPFGEVAWRYRLADDSMIALGLTDASHTRADGARSSGASYATDSGHVLGASTRYDGGPIPLAATPWLFDAGSQATTKIGLYDANHTSVEGLQDNRFHILSDSGHVAGSATRLGIVPGPSSSPGQSVWLARAGSPTTTRIGLIDDATLGAASFTSTSGEQTSEFDVLLGSGDVLGSSLAFIGDQPTGSAAWYHDASAGTTRAIGLYGAAYTAPDGSFSSGATHWTESGFVAGSSLRSDFFPTLWIYSVEADRVDAIMPLDPPAPGGFVFPEILFLSESGMVVGRFTYFDGQSPEGVVRFFVWTASGRTVHLEERIEGGFEAAGWVAIETIEAVRDDRILGSGRRSNGDVDGLMLVPLPEPSQTTLVALGLLASAWQGARRNRARTRSALRSRTAIVGAGAGASAAPRLDVNPRS